MYISFNSDDSSSVSALCLRSYGRLALGSRAGLRSGQYNSNVEHKKYRIERGEVDR